MAASIQEELLNAYSETMFGKGYLFHPNKYGPRAHEPADLAWVSHKCVILFYATARSRKSYRWMNKHNNDQMQEWLAVWKAGEPLIGDSCGIRLEFQWDDIDHIIGISVVEGRNAKCEFGSFQILRDPSLKLSACATLTTKVVHLLSQFRSGPRDILSLIMRLGFENQKFVSEEDCIGMLLTEIITETSIIKDEIGISSLQYDTRIDHDLKMFLENMRRINTKEFEDTMISINDLTRFDISWLMVNLDKLERDFREHAQAHEFFLIAKRENKNYTVKAMVISSNTPIAKVTEEIHDKEPGLALISLIENDVNYRSAIRSAVATKQKGASSLEIEAAAARKYSMRWQLQSC